MGLKHRASRTILLFLVPFGACSDAPPRQEVLRPVRTQVAVASSGSRPRSFSGTARAGQEMDLSFRLAGRIEQLAVKVGDAVRAGDLIAQLEKTDFEINVRQARANLAQAQAEFKNAAADLDRTRGLYEDQNVSKNELDQAVAQSQSTQAQVDAANESLARTRRQLGYAGLLAPVNGSIASVPVEVSENVRPGQTVVRMTSGLQSEVEVPIPEVLIAQIQEGAPVTVNFDALPGATFDAVVTEVGVASTGTATTFPVTVRLAGPSQGVRSGMAASVEFLFEDPHGPELIFLPSHAVGEDRDGRFVFVLEPGPEDHVGTVHRLPVELGEMTRNGIEIVSGLSEGQRVVTAGVRRLSDGQRVKLLEENGGSP